MVFDKDKIKRKMKALNILKRQGKHKKTSERLPPGQNLVNHFPVLDLGKQPNIDFDSWSLEIVGNSVKKKINLSLSDLKSLGVKNYSEDFHCVTGWSKYDVKWRGVPFKKIVDFVNPSKDWKHVIQYGEDGYSTNVPKSDVLRDNVFLAFELDGGPIPREHGVVRLIIPHLYGWKGCKFLTRLEFSDEDKPGFWEKRGYHNHGNVMKEERYSKSK